MPVEQRLQKSLGYQFENSDYGIHVVIFHNFIFILFLKSALLAFVGNHVFTIFDF